MAFDTMTESDENNLEAAMRSPNFDWKKFPMLSTTSNQNNSGKTGN